MGWARTEKTALVDTLRRSDRDAATLCTGWSARRLLAHLVQREQDPVGGAADLVSRPEPGQEKHLGRLADTAADPEGYSTLVDRFVAGPPRWSPMSWASEQVNLLEYVIHHEDVRRGGVTPAPPRQLPAAQDEAIWRQVGFTARLAFRRSPVPVTLATPGGRSRAVKPGGGGVALTGGPVELALYASGRRAAAHVEVSGPPETVATFREWVAAS